MLCRAICNYAQPIRTPTGAIQIDLFTIFTQQTNRSTRLNFTDGLQLANHYPLTLLEFLRQNKPITLQKLDLLHWTYNQQEHLQWSTSPLPTKIFSAAVREMLNTTDDYTNFSFEVGHLSGGRFGMSMAFTFLNVVLSMTGQLSNPSCSTQSDFDLSSNETFVYMFGSHRSFCWSDNTTTVYSDASSRRDNVLQRKTL